MAKKKAKAASSSSKSLTKGLTWHFFLPAVGGFFITWIFSQSTMLSLQVGVVVLVCSFLAVWLKDK